MPAADLPGGNPSRVSKPLLLRSDAVDASPLYSPDGRFVAFTSTRTGWGELWLYQPSEPEPRQLTHFEGAGVIFLLSWSPDSTSIVFSLRRNGATNIVVYNVALGTLKEITSTRNRDCSPVYSSDGQFIYFSSNDDGTPRVWRIRADGSGRAEPLFLEAVAGFQLSQDGKWFHFTQNGESLTVSRRSLLDGSTEEIFHASGRTSFVNGLAIANHRVYIAVSPDDISKSDVFEVNPDTKTYRVVAHLKDLPSFSLSGVPGFSVSPDGRKLIAERGMRDESTFYATELLHQP